MTRNDVIKHLCQTVSLVYRTKNDYSRPSDGFCVECQEHQGASWGFQHTGETLEYIRKAVIKQLVADGYTPNLRVFKEGTK